MEFSWHDLFFGYDGDKESHGSSSFASNREISKVLHKANKGFYIADKLRLSPVDAFKSTLLVAPSGSGKTTRVIKNNLLRNWDGKTSSLAVLDPSAELYHSTAAFMASQGFEVLVIDVTNPSESIGINPIWHCTSKSSIRALAQLIIESVYKNKGGNDEFWKQSGISMLSLLLTMMIKAYPKEKQTLKELYGMLNLFGAHGQEQLDALSQESLSDFDFNEYCSLIANDNKVLMSMVATAKAALFPYTDEILSHITSKDFDFAKLRSKPTVLYITVPAHRIHQYSSFLAILFHTLFEALIENEAGRYVYLLLDEFSQCKLNNFSTLITTVRKRNIACLLAIQSMEQLQATYGMNDSKTIFDNCATKIFLSGLSLHGSRIVSDMLGHTTQLYNQDTSLWGTDDKASRVRRNLLTPEEVRTIPQNEAIVFHGNHLPMKLKIPAFYENRTLRKRSKMKL